MNVRGIAIGAVAVIVVVVISIFAGIRFAEKSQAPDAPPQTASGTSASPSQSSATGTTAQRTSAPGAPAVAPKPKSGSAYLPVIPLTSPVGGEAWVIGTQHLISWSMDAGVTGGIYLVDAATDNTVGWITSSNAPHQTSYTWGTSEVYLSRGSPVKKNIGPGIYIIRIRFDAPNRPDSVSKSFSIIYAGQVQIPSHTVILKNYSFFPASLTVPKGDTVVFQNNDTITYTIKLASLSPIVIPAGQSFTFDTSVLTPGPYPVYATDYSAMTFTLTVR